MRLWFWCFGGLGDARGRRCESSLVITRDSGAAVEKPNVHHGNIQIHTGRRNESWVAVRVRAVDRVQFALHVVRHGICVSWREEDECG